MHFLRKHLSIYYVCLLSVVAPLCFSEVAWARPTQPGDEVIGSWKFVGVLDGVATTSIDENEARQLLGRVMKIRRSGTQFGTQACAAADFETKRVEPNLYVWREAQISAAKLHLPNPVTVVDIGCTQVFVKRRDHAIIFWDGFFFSATRVGR